jgi:hypothetical protein
MGCGQFSRHAYPGAGEVSENVEAALDPIEQLCGA